MISKRFLFYAIVALFFLSLALAIAAVYRVRVTSDQASVAVTSGHLREQAARWIFSNTPFYFPFKARGTFMNSTLPFTQDFGQMDRRNSQGFRTAEYTIAHPPGTFRILIIGDSITLGTAVPLEQTFSSILARLLNESCSRFQVEVIPLANSGHRLADELIKLLAHGQYLQPDLVIVQISPDDVDFLNYFSILYFQKIKDRFSIYSQKEDQVYQEDSVDWKVFSEAITQFNSWSKKTSVPVAFLAFPPIDSRSAGRNFNHYDPAIISSPTFTQFSKAVDQIRHEGFLVDYLLEIFRDRAGDKALNISDGVPQLNTFAHRLVAHELQTFLVHNNFVNCTQSRIKPKDAQWDEEHLLRRQAADNWLDYNASFSEQIRLYQKLSSLFPRNPWVAYQLGNAYFGSQQWQYAFDAFSSLTDLANGFGAPQYQIALCTSGVNRKIALLEDLLKIVPDHTPAIQELSRLFLLENRIPEACKMFSRLIEIPAYQQQFDMSKEAYQKYHCDSTK
jgi:hypothetical protein